MTVASLDDIEAQVTATEGVEASAVLLLSTLHDELVTALAADDQVRLQGVVDRLGASRDALAGAVAANPGQ